MRLRLNALPEPPRRASFTKADWWGALGVFLLVFVATFPVVIPFIFMQQLHTAMRTSNLIAIILLFVTGFVFGRITGRRPWLVGAAMVAIGILLVGMTIALGG